MVHKEILSSRYDTCHDYMTQEWLSQALEEVLIKIEDLRMRFHSTFPSANTFQGIYKEVEQVDWTEGFWTGILWLAYDNTKNEKYKVCAETYLPIFEERLDRKLKVNTHDLGFLYTLSCVSCFKTDYNKTAKQIALRAADELLSRYDKTAKIIQAWGDLRDSKKQGRMIIDCNLNVPLLFWAAEITGDCKYADAATQHLINAMKFLVRDDASTFHTYYMDVSTGLPKYGCTHQGYSDNSCWARGQAWAILGFALNYHYMKDERLLEIAICCANYFLNRLPDDYVSYWDLIFEDCDHAYKDSSAASIAVCGLLEIIEHSKDSTLNAKYRNAIVNIMSSLRENYTNDCSDGFITHGMYNYAKGMGIDECNLWGDYFYLEAITRLRNKWNQYW